LDDIGLATLWNELKKDCEVAEAAYETSVKRLNEKTSSGNEGCAHHLCRLFNVVEQMSLRIAKAFENNIDDDRGWHAELIRRMSIAIPEVRPALFSDEVIQPLRELRAFRHVFTHAYDLQLDPEKLRLLLKYARAVVPELKKFTWNFVGGVAAMHGLSIPAES
jgi:hypothetical protein